MKQINPVDGLENDNGQLVTDPEEMVKSTKRCFENVFSSQGVGNLDHILSGVGRCISESMNQVLIANYTRVELVLALKGMGPTKANIRNGQFPYFIFLKVLAYFRR